jgi:hypothetical protein
MSRERLPFSLAYFGSLALTLFFAIGVSHLACISEIKLIE